RRRSSRTRLVQPVKLVQRVVGLDHQRAVVDLGYLADRRRGQSSGTVVRGLRRDGDHAPYLQVQNQSALDVVVSVLTLFARGFGADHQCPHARTALDVCKCHSISLCSTCRYTGEPSPSSRRSGPRSPAETRLRSTARTSPRIVSAFLAPPPAARRSHPTPPGLQARWGAGSRVLCGSSSI